MKKMKLLMLALLFSGSIFAVDWENSSRENKEFCALVHQAFFRAQLDCDYRSSNNFPKRVGESTTFGNISVPSHKFTTEDAEKCRSYEKEIDKKPEEGYMIQVTSSKDGTSSFIEARLKNQNYDALIEAREREVEQRSLQRWKIIEEAFDFYVID